MNKTMYTTHRTVSKFILQDKSSGTVCLGESMLNQQSLPRKLIRHMPPNEGQSFNVVK